MYQLSNLLKLHREEQLQLVRQLISQAGQYKAYDACRLQMSLFHRATGRSMVS